MNRLIVPQDRLISQIYEHLAAEREKNDGLARGPAKRPLSRKQIARFIETTFWSSLRSDEGRKTQVNAALISPDRMERAVAFATPLPYDEEQVAWLAPAVPRGGCMLVHGTDAALEIWGFSLAKPAWSDVIAVEATEPGIVRIGIGAFNSFAVFDGRSNPLLAGTHSNLAVYLNKLMKKKFPVADSIESHAIFQESLALVSLARMIVANGHGGTLLIVPETGGAWSESLNPFTYRYAAPDTSIRDSIRSELNEICVRKSMILQLQNSGIGEELKRLVTGVLAQTTLDIGRNLTAVAAISGVDGATIITRDLQVVGFGAKISAGEGDIPEICMFRPEPGGQKVIPSPLEQVGGTRHQSATRFVARHRDTIALVISQDRHLSLIHWHEPIRSVAVIRNAEWWL